MGVKVTVDQLQERLSELLDQTVKSGEECVIQRDGKDYAVLVSSREWKRRADPRLNDASLTPPEQELRPQEIGRRLDALGPDYRLAPDKQARTKGSLARSEELTPAEQRELDALLREGEAVMLRRAEALDRLLRGSFLASWL